MAKLSEIYRLIGNYLELHLIPVKSAIARLKKIEIRSYSAVV